MKDNEIARIKLEEREKCQQELNRARKEVGVYIMENSSFKQTVVLH